MENEARNRRIAMRSRDEFESIRVGQSSQKVASKKAAQIRDSADRIPLRILASANVRTHTHTQRSNKLDDLLNLAAHLATGRRKERENLAAKQTHTHGKETRMNNNERGWQTRQVLLLD